MCVFFISPTLYVFTICGRTLACFVSLLREPQVYSWFTEGFETADLREAKALLDQWQ